MAEISVKKVWGREYGDEKGLIKTRQGCGVAHAASFAFAFRENKVVGP